MWPFDRELTEDERIDALIARQNELKTRLSALESEIGVIASSQKRFGVELQAQLDTQEAWLRKVSGVVHGRKGSEERAEKIVPNKSLDNMSKAELRHALGIMPGRPTPKFSPSEET